MKDCSEKDAQSKPGFFTNCLIENRHEITETKCKSFLQKMAAIVFEDYRLIYGFYDHCAEDVQKLECGTLAKAQDEEVRYFQISF